MIEPPRFPLRIGPPGTGPTVSPEHGHQDNSSSLALRKTLCFRAMQKNKGKAALPAALGKGKAALPAALAKTILRDTADGRD